MYEIMMKRKGHGTRIFTFFLCNFCNNISVAVQEYENIIRPYDIRFEKLIRNSLLWLQVKHLLNIKVKFIRSVGEYSYDNTYTGH